MEELIQKKNIEVNIDVDNWEDAIKSVGYLLMNSKQIEDGYVNSMINSVKELGPYIVLSQGFALAHAAPNTETVHKPSLAIVTLKKPVKFGSPNDPVKVLMCLACMDKATHLDLLSKAAKKLMQENFVENAAKCKTVDELYHVIND
ncbi:PTS sugar transporter subunit IIA [Solobacterium moorei]|uniref:Ascorbate-specific PTS system EIIA component n=1 Tax=Solobacterium moorei TaxID=102148 RepID=A0A412PFA6_9FIRM|nr:PTS sugar transporter subunit IIA [Solobacterium moorei]RGT56328.1 PTS sugar transporter subunit IIA [Solobacterium moorei]